MKKKKKKIRIKNLSYTLVETDPSTIKFKLKMLEMDELSSLLFTQEEDHEYLAVEKLLTFADIPTYAKYVYTSKQKKAKDVYSEEKILSRINKNILFYNENKEMINFENNNQKNKRF